MAEESSSPQTPPTKISGNDISFLRNSTGKNVSSSSGGKAIPNYLRASTGSCHDFCKYGHKHAVEDKARRPFPRRVAAKSNDCQVSVDSAASLGKKKPLPTVENPNMTRSLDRLSIVSGAKKKTPFAKPKLEVSSERLGMSVRNKRSSSAKRSTSVNPKPVGSKLLISPGSLGELLDARSGKKDVAPGVAVSRRSSLRGADSFNKNKSLKKVVVAKPAQNEKLKISPEAHIGLIDEKSGKKAASLRVVVSRRSSFGGFDGSNTKNKSFKKVVLSSLDTTKDHVIAKPAQDAKAKISLEDRRGHRDEKSGKNISMNAVASRDAQAKVSRGSSLGSVDSLNKTKKTVKKVVSLSLNTSNNHVVAEPAQDGAHKVEENTAYVIKSEAEDNTLATDQSESLAREVDYVVTMQDEEEGTLEWDQSESFPREVEYVYKIETEDSTTFELYRTEHHVDKVSSISKFDQSEIQDLAVDSLPNSLSLSDNPSSLPNDDGAEGDEEFIYTTSEYENDTYSENSEVESVGGSEKKVHKGSGVDHGEDENEQAWKMRFRRGMVMDIKPEEDGPRRLRFRRGTQLGSQDTEPDGQRRRFKRRGEEDNDETAGSNSEIVILKHQGVRGRKDAQGLFNNVIEETASKLVEARKSKVKALVGAFETVISLQDGKPSSNTTAT